jgi:hypothetical protein
MSTIICALSRKASTLSFSLTFSYCGGTTQERRSDLKLMLPINLGTKRNTRLVTESAMIAMRRFSLREMIAMPKIRS